MSIRTQPPPRLPRAAAGGSRDLEVVLATAIEREMFGNVSRDKDAVQPVAQIANVFDAMSPAVAGKVCALVVQAT